MKLIPLILALSCVLLFQAGGSRAEDPKVDLPETKVVLRISREFIYELTAKRFQRDVPVALNAGGVAVAGTAHVDGATSVEIQGSENACSFELGVQGQVSTHLVATVRAVELQLHGSAPFSARRRIVFEDIAFSAHPAEVTTDYHSTIDRICTVRPGLLGAMTRGIASSKARRTLPESDVQAAAEIRTRLTEAIEKESDDLLILLNKVGAIVKEGEQLLREEKLLSARSVQHYLAATPKSLYISVGPPGHRIAKLPRLNASDRQPIELWVAIKKPGKTDRFSPVLENWKLVKPFLLPRIAQRSPESAKILDQVQIRKVEDWHVVTFAPDLLDSLENASTK